MDSVNCLTDIQDPSVLSNEQQEMGIVNNITNLIEDDTDDLSVILSPDYRQGPQSSNEPNGRRETF